jgi:hypothetical protein
MHLKEVLPTGEGDSTRVSLLGFTLVGWWRTQNVTPLPARPLIFTFVTTLLVLYIAMENFEFDYFWGLILKENTCKIYLGVQMGYV